jgi:hypothetical protein
LFIVIELAFCDRVSFPSFMAAKKERLPTLDLLIEALIGGLVTVQTQSGALMYGTLISCKGFERFVYCVGLSSLCHAVCRHSVELQNVTIVVPNVTIFFSVTTITLVDRQFSPHKKQ